MAPTSTGYSTGVNHYVHGRCARCISIFIKYRHLLLIVTIISLLYYRHILVRNNLLIMLIVVYITLLVVPPGVVFHAYFSASQEFIADVLESLTPGRLALLLRMALAGF